MFKVILCFPLYCITACILSFAYSQNSVISKVDSAVLVNWNKLTIQSLHNRIKNITEKNEKKIYRDRIELANYTFGTNNENKIDTNTLRYSFLSFFSYLKRNFKGSFYLIETRYSGEYVQFRNYIVWAGVTDEYNKLSVVNFEFDKWILEDTTYQVRFCIKGKIKSFFTKIGQGINKCDVVITKFENGEAVESEYFPYKAIQKSSMIESVLRLK